MLSWWAHTKQGIRDACVMKCGLCLLMGFRRLGGVGFFEKMVFVNMFCKLLAFV